jgi:fucose permease
MSDDASVPGNNAPHLQVFVFALFFIFGGITSLNDVIIPKLKELFTLGYAQAMLVQSAVAGWPLLSIGLVNSIVFPTIFSFASQGLYARRASEAT